MYILEIQKLKVKENHQNSDRITSHHLGNGKLSSNLVEKSGILLLLGNRFSPRFHNPRILWKNTAQRSETKTIAQKRVSHRHVKYDSIENESSWRIIRDL